jgi:hypothetical protein
MNTTPETGRFFQDAGMWQRQFGGDPRIHPLVMGHHRDHDGERYDDYVPKFKAVELIHSPSAALFRIDQAAGVTPLGPCSGVILHGDPRSTQWIFGHLTMGHGFPTVSLLQEAKRGLSGDLSAVFFGARSERSIQEDIADRARQVEIIMKQLTYAGLSIPQSRMPMYWNPFHTAYNQVFARMDENNTPWVLVELVKK